MTVNELIKDLQENCDGDEEVYHLHVFEEYFGLKRDIISPVHKINYNIKGVFLTDEI